MKRNWCLWGAFVILAIPALACGPGVTRVTPTPTKTPRLIRTVEPISSSPTAAQSVLPTQTFTPDVPPPTDTPVPEPIVVDTPTPEPQPPTDTPTPEPPPPTNTPPPPPPPTNTPPPPPPTNTPAPPPPTAPPANRGPDVVIELPGGDQYGIGDEVRVRITVTDPDGVGAFEWGVFTQNNVSVTGGDRNCGNSTSCSIEEEFDAALPGIFQIGVEAKDGKGAGTIEVKQIYVG